MNCAIIELKCVVDVSDIINICEYMVFHSILRTTPQQIARENCRHLRQFIYLQMVVLSESHRFDVLIQCDQ